MIDFSDITEQYRVVQFKKLFYPQFKQIRRKYWLFGKEVTEWKFFNGRDSANGFDNTLYDRYYGTLDGAKSFITKYIAKQKEPAFVIHKYP